VQAHARALFLNVRVSVDALTFSASCVFAPPLHWIHLGGACDGDENIRKVSFERGQTMSYIMNVNTNMSSKLTEHA